MSRPVSIAVFVVLIVLLALGLGRLARSTHAGGIVHSGAAEAPIASAVTVPAGSDLVFLAGAIAHPSDPNAPRDDPQTFGGDTQAQTVKVIGQIKDTLAGFNLALGDVVMMHVYLAPDPNKGGKMDFAGMMAGYKQFFGTPDQPNKPARSAFQVGALAAPGAMVEIEVIAAHPH